MLRCCLGTGRGTTGGVLAVPAWGGRVRSPRSAVRPKSPTKVTTPIAACLSASSEYSLLLAAPATGEVRLCRRCHSIAGLGVDWRAWACVIDPACVRFPAVESNDPVARLAQGAATSWRPCQRGGSTLLCQTDEQASRHGKGTQAQGPPRVLSPGGERRGAGKTDNGALAATATWRRRGGRRSKVPEPKRRLPNQNTKAPLPVPLLTSKHLPYLAARSLKRGAAEARAPSR